MNHRYLGYAALLLCGTILIFIGSAVVLAARNDYDFWNLTYLISITSATLVGGFITSRRPDNLVGWFVVTCALCFATGEFTRQYAIYGVLTNPGALPLARIMASPPYWIWFPAIILLFVLLPLYFPNGQLLSPRWRPIVWLAIAAALIISGLAAVQPVDVETPGIPNPLGISALRPVDEWASAFIENVTVASWLSLAVAAAVSLGLRFWRANGEERQQIKWFTYAVALLVCYSFVNRLFLADYLPFFLNQVLFNIVLLGLWVALAVAVLHYRLYDIDFIIHRTLVYSALTAALAIIYLGSVVLLQGAFALVGGQQSSAAIVLSTLAIAALFGPLRRRVQNVIDRRFYRGKYDAEKTLAAFAATARDEVELERLAAELLHVVGETMQPAHVSLWLREGVKL